MAAINLTGTIVKADLKTRRPFCDDLARYSPNSERLDCYLDVELRLLDGKTVYFQVTVGQQVVSSCPGAAVVIYHDVKPEWVKEEGDVKVATAEHSNNNHLSPLVKVGDTITIRGSVKAEKVSRKGKPYKVLNRVKRLPVHRDTCLGCVQCGRGSSNR